MPITIDDSSFPRLRAVFDGVASDEEYRDFNTAYRNAMLRARAHGTKISMAIDGRKAVPPTAKQRREMADFIEANATLMPQASVGLAMALSNALQRGVLTALLWVRPYPVPTFVASTLPECEAWLESQRRSGAHAAHP